MLKEALEDQLCGRCRFRKDCERENYYCPPLLYFYDFYKNVEEVENRLRLILLKVIPLRVENKR